MTRLSKLLGTSVISVSIFALIYGANAATARNGTSNARSATANSGVGTAQQRMPSMPTLPIISVGNVSTDIPEQWNPNIPNNPDPDTPDEPNPPQPDNPNPGSECPDGGVKDSKYTVDMCMNDVLQCVNNGALPNGLNDLFNEDLRNAIVNGMGQCINQTEKCVAQVRRDCRNIYRSSADVWIDFNSRKVQPEYYAFVLRKTGLTPNQAENTCWLLDKNTYGSSFNAVSISDKTTHEYNNPVGAYNSQHGNILIKRNPLGVKVNNGNPGVDGARGHYARWDATTGTCLIRIGAYNKDKPIINSWLFGAVGDDRPAEAWKETGETFNCGKDLFGFSLMKDTNTAAVVGIGGGTVLGAGAGAIAGHGARAFDCSNDGHLKKLTEQLRESGKTNILNQYLIDTISVTGEQITQSQCNDILELQALYNEYKDAISNCQSMNSAIVETETEVTVTTTVTETGSSVSDNAVQTAVSNSLNQALNSINSQNDTGRCMFKPLNMALTQGTGVECTAQTGCRTIDEINREVNTLGGVLSRLEILKGEKGNMGKSIATGAAIGAGAGGLATAITAYVEKNNINCRVGDNLEQVGFGKSHHIGTLKDFYVKWNLRLPDTIAPTAKVTDCKSWQDMCAMYHDLNDCKNAQFNYKPNDANKTELVYSACKPSGSVCVENYSVAKSYGACK
ncbi:MAG: hypothetical protein R8M37_04210 [Alphaproteobacteria bacterium]|nr:hypothetical protein [Alphaproteobacteria bacterium]